MEGGGGARGAPILPLHVQLRSSCFPGCPPSPHSPPRQPAPSSIPPRPTPSNPGSGDPSEEAPRLLLLFLADRRRAAHASASSARTFMLCQVHPPCRAVLRFGERGESSCRAVQCKPGGNTTRQPAPSLVRRLPAAKQCLPPPLLQAFAEEVTNLQKQDAGPEEFTAKLVQAREAGHSQLYFVLPFAQTWRCLCQATPRPLHHLRLTNCHPYRVNLPFVLCSTASAATSWTGWVLTWR